MRIIRLKEVMKSTGLSRSAIYKFVGEGIFPKSVPLGSRAVGWVEEEVLDWVRARIAGRGTPDRVEGGASALAFVEEAGYSLPVVQVAAAGFPRFAVGAIDQGHWTYSYRCSVSGVGGKAGRHRLGD